MLATKGLGDLGLSSCHVHEHVINYLVFSEIVYHRNISIWHRICGRGSQNQNLTGNPIKLSMIEIPISGASYIHGDNMLVIHNTSNPESTLEKSVMQWLIMSSMSLWQWEDH